MSMTMTSIVAAAEQLSSADRIRLVEHVLATLDKPAPEIDERGPKRANGGSMPICAERRRPPTQKMCLPNTSNRDGAVP